MPRKLKRHTLARHTTFFRPSRMEVYEPLVDATRWFDEDGILIGFRITEGDDHQDAWLASLRTLGEWGIPHPNGTFTTVPPGVEVIER